MKYVIHILHACMRVCVWVQKYVSVYILYVCMQKWREYTCLGVM